MSPRALALAAALLLVACSSTPDGDTVPEPAGIWTGPMQGAVPATLAGGTVLDTDALAALLPRQPVLVDVGALPHKPDNVAADAWVPPPHRTIPGSVWLPGVGAGQLASEREAWYRARLMTLTGGDVQKPVVLFCHPNCWGSWNAAKRAIAFGYRAVHWYPGGIEGWQDSGRDTQVAQPEAP